MTINQDTLKQIVEAAIMAAEAPIEIRQILGLFPDDARPEREQIVEVLEALDRETEGRGVELRKIGNGWRYQTRGNLAPWLRKLNEGRPPRYSRALMETLAIIAYRQPVTRGDIEDIRGVTVSSEIMRTLQEREWIKQVGVRDVPGHPALHGTTPNFLAYFNLASLGELPTLIEQRDLESIAREQNIELPFGESEESDEGEQEQEQEQSGEVPARPAQDEEDEEEHSVPGYRDQDPGP